MNAITGGRPLRIGISVAALVSLALLGTACSSNHATGVAGQQTGSRYQQALAYAKCMRAHGDPSWPDPSSNGMFGNNYGSLDESSAAYKTANQACSKYQSSGSNGLTPAQQQQALGQLRMYARCMRAHQIPKFPDPSVDSTGVYFSYSGNIGQHTPQFQVAQQACASLAPGASS